MHPPIVGSSPIYEGINLHPMAHEASTTGATAESPPGSGIGRRRQLLFGAGIIGAFLLVGIALGLTGRFGMQFMIALFDVHENPTSNQYVGIVFLVNIFVLLYAGMIMAGIAGLVTGLSFPDRVTAASIASGAALVGFVLLVFPALFIMISVLGGGGGGGGPSLPFTAVLLSAFVAAITAGATAVLGSIIGN